MIKEFCTENLDLIVPAINNGAKRIELCANLNVGGLTPDATMIEEAVALAKDIPVMVIIRPHAQSFVYDEDDLAIMIAQIAEAKKLGAAGIVIGCLTEENKLDEIALEKLLKAATGLEITFHMAFDEMDFETQKQAMHWLKDHNVTRILTHGGPMQKSIMTNLPNLVKLQMVANLIGITLMPGGGLTYENLPEIMTILQPTEVHGTKIVAIN